MTTCCPTIRALLSLPALSDAQLSPDGSKVAVVVRNTDWEADRSKRCIRILHRKNGWVVESPSLDEFRGVSPRWSPDGRTLAFVSSGDDGAVLNLRTEERARILCSLPPGSHAFQWSPDGAALSFLAPVPAKTDDRSQSWAVDGGSPDPVELWKADSATGEVQRWSNLRGSIADYAWDPEGNSVACCVARSARACDWDTGSLIVLEEDASEASALLEGRCRRAVWSPNGDRLAVVRLQEPTFIASPRLEIVNLNGELTQHAPVDDEFQLLHWTSRGLLALHVAGPSSLPAWIDPETGALSPALEQTPQGYTLIEGWFGEGCALASSGDLLSSVAYDLDHPGEIALLDLARGDVTYITQEQDTYHSWRIPTPQTIRWDTSDGTPIEGILIPPRDCVTGERRPLIVVLHGGPTSMSAQAPLADNDWIWGPIPQLVSRGAYVLLPNYRGSVGYGAEFRAANVGKLGMVNADDIASGIQYLVQQGRVDSQRVAALGASHGGYLASFLATRPNLLAAAVMRSGICDWTLNERLNQNPDWEHQYFNGPPEAKAESYAAASTLTYVNSATAPVLIIHGDQDRQAPTANAYALHRHLTRHKVPCRLLIYHGMGHGGATLTQTEQSLDETLQWFERWLDLGPDSNEGT